MGHTFRPSYKKLQIYNISKQLLISTYNIISKFPSKERYNLCEQTRRAVLSVSLNIAEGSSRRSQKEQGRFATIALSSLAEVDACVDIALELKYIEDGDIKLYRNLRNELYFKLIAYRKSKLSN